MIITSRVEVAIGHRLLGYIGKCAFIHGHNYTFEISIQGNTDALGLVVDFKDLKKDIKEILKPFDHALVLHREDPLAELLPTEKVVLLSVNPTAENFASLLYGSLIDRNYSPSTVIVRETEDGWAEAIAVDRKVRIVSIQ